MQHRTWSLWEKVRALAAVLARPLAPLSVCEANDIDRGTLAAVEAQQLRRARTNFHHRLAVVDVRDCVRLAHVDSFVHRRGVAVHFKGLPF
jgi:hypothetical protein